jgi:hypothetical protein
MATYKFKCSVCQKEVSARSKYYKRYLGKYDCDNQEELSKYYVCKWCRKKRGETIRNKKNTPFNLHENPKYSEIQGFISLEAIKLQEIGLTNQLARENFLENVRLIFEQENIKTYNFIIENSELKGISIKLPLLGDVVMDIKLKREI